MESGATLVMKQSYAGGSKKGSVINGNFHVHLQEGSKLTHTYLQESEAGVTHVDVISAAVKGSAQYDLNILTVGGSISRYKQSKKSNSSHTSRLYFVIIL